jgi:hypothetical protein
MSLLGTVYLLHFDTPFKHARHYTGTTARSAQLTVEGRWGTPLRGYSRSIGATAASSGVRNLAHRQSDPRRSSVRIRSTEPCPASRSVC